MRKILRNFSKADIEEYDGKVLSRKLNHCIEKAYCQCNWQRITKFIFILFLKYRCEPTIGTLSQAQIEDFCNVTFLLKNCSTALKKDTVMTTYSILSLILYRYRNFQT